MLAGVFDAVLTEEAALLGPSWNVAPGADVRVVVERAAGDRDRAVATRQLRVARWGLLPSWAKDPAMARRAINARAESAATKPFFRDAMASFRAVVPADCWYEWQRADIAGPSAGGPVLVVAGASGPAGAGPARAVAVDLRHCDPRRRPRSGLVAPP